MTENTFVVPLKKWGNSYVLKVPPQIAKVYEEGQEIQVTINSKLGRKGYSLKQEWKQKPHPLDKCKSMDEVLEVAGVRKPKQ